MQVLFIHQNFPGQFHHLAAQLAANGHEVHALGMTPRGVPGVQVHRYRLPDQAMQARFHPPQMAEFATKAIRGQACAAALHSLRTARGLRPAIVVAHPGWGEALYARDVFPDAVHLHFLEFFYRAEGQDVGFDPEFPARHEPQQQAMQIRTKNFCGLLSLQDMDHGLAPTRWQAGTYPDWAQRRTDVIFDGIDTQAIAPDPQARLRLPDGRELSRADEVVSFINRNLEPYRGYHVFMRALPELMRRRPRARFVIVGADGVSYGAAPPPGQSWKQIYLAEVASRVDPSRLHFVGRLPRADLTALLQISRCHVYLTYPFVMSWSAVEAMSAGCPLVASNTAPVREFVTDGETGRLFDFFDQRGLADAVMRTLDEPLASAAMAQRARAHVIDQLDLRAVCLPRQTALLDRLVAARERPGQGQPALSAAA